MINENRAFNLRMKTISKKKGQKDALLNNADMCRFVLDARVPINTPRLNECRRNYSEIISKAWSEMRKSNFNNAINIFNDALTIYHDDPNVLLDRSKCYEELREFDSALNDLNVVLSRDSSNYRALLAKAELLYNMGNYQDSYLCFEEGFRNRKDMVAFEFGMTKAREAMNNSTDENDPQSATKIDIEANKREVLGDLSKDYEFLSEFYVNVRNGLSTQDNIKNLLRYMDKENENLHSQIQ